MRIYIKCHRCDEVYKVKPGYYGDWSPLGSCPGCGIDHLSNSIMVSCGVQRNHDVIREYDESELCNECGKVLDIYDKAPTCRSCRWKSALEAETSFAPGGPYMLKMVDNLAQ